MTKRKLQNQERGLYRSEYEHDACGVGMIVNIHGNKSHELVDQALRVLENMRHRGAEVGKDGDVVICDGNPMESSSKITKVFINGKEVK